MDGTRASCYLCSRVFLHLSINWVRFMVSTKRLETQLFLYFFVTATTVKSTAVLRSNMIVKLRDPGDFAAAHYM